MNGGSLWERECLRPHDLPNLQELFGVCDRSLLQRVIIEDFTGCHAYMDKARYKVMMKRLDATLDSMLSLPVRRKPTKGWVLVPQESYEVDLQESTLRWQLRAALVPLFDVTIAERLVRASQMPVTSFKQVKKRNKHLRSFMMRAGRMGDDVWDVGTWGGRDYALILWEEMLGCKVWLGGKWCCRERYHVLASAFWEMTTYGFEHDLVSVRIACEETARFMGKSDLAAKKMAHFAGGFDRAGKSHATHTVKHSESLAVSCGLQPPDRFTREVHNRLAKRVAVLNHQAHLLFFEQMLDLARRMERG